MNQPIAEQAYLFRHALVRDAAYSLLLPSDRSELHGRAVDAMERMLPEEALPAHSAELAAHARLARADSADAALVARERRFTHMAFDFAASRDQLDEALGFNQRLFALAPEHERPRLLMRAGMFNLALGRLDESQACADEIERMAKAAGDAGLLARARRTRALAEAAAGRHGAAAFLLEQALETFNARGEVVEAARTMNAKARLLVEAKHYAEAESLLTELLRLNADDPGQLGLTYEGLAEVQLRSGRPEQAVENFRHALALAETGPARQKAFPLVGIGEALIQLGRHGEAREGLLFALDCHRRVGALPDVVYVLSLLAGVEEHAGRRAQALEFRRQALQAAQQAGEPALIQEAARRVGEVAAPKEAE